MRVCVCVVVAVTYMPITICYILYSVLSVGYYAMLDATAYTVLLNRNYSTITNGEFSEMAVILSKATIYVFS